MKHVAILTPTHSAETPVEYTTSLVRTAELLMRSGVAYTHFFLVGNAIIHDARNVLVNWALQMPTMTDVFFIDGDIGWKPEEFFRILMSPHHVVGAAYPQKPQTDNEPLKFNVGINEPSISGNLVTVDYLGGGFVKISRKAIEKLIAKTPEAIYSDRHGNPVHGLFQAPIANGAITGEDAYFYRLWQKHGGKVFLDPDITLLHIGRKVYKGNLADTLEQAKQDAEGQSNVDSAGHN